VFILRRVLFVLFILLLQDYPFFQCVVVSILNFLMLLYIFWVRPFTSTARNILECVNEGFIYALSFLMLSFMAG